MKKKTAHAIIVLLIIVDIIAFARFVLYTNLHKSIKKPVLYLYPTKDMNVSVTFDNPNLVTVSYPKFQGKWNVFVKKDGTIVDDNGRNYYALYWEEAFNKEVDFKEGFYVEKENAISFLENKLDEIGLNEREANEFIMYWLPILERNEKNVVYFELTEEKQSNNKIIIEPKVDSLLRLTIHVKKVNKKVNIKEQKIQRFKRVGFTVVEWGGVDYSGK